MTGLTMSEARKVETLRKLVFWWKAETALRGQTLLASTLARCIQLRIDALTRLLDRKGLPN